jgi:hypothetical protein
VVHVTIREDRASALQFVEQNQLRPFLLEAGEALDHAFGCDVIEALSLLRDEEGFCTLFCLVRTRSELELAMHSLREFDDQWWLQRSAETHGKLNFDFDLV